MARDIEGKFREFAFGRRTEVRNLEGNMEGEGDGWEVKCVHVERVKSFAPGIWHCVFDVWIHRGGKGMV